MPEYDIVIAGGGPAGCSAGRTAAQQGAKVAVIEEHPEIGLPRHCSGMFADSGFTREIRELIGDEKFVVRDLKQWRVFSPAGEVVQEFPLGDRGACIISRERYDKELARLAANAGADIFLNTRVTGLLRHDGRVAGVTTSSQKRPEISARLVIIAGGYHDLQNGLVKQEGMTRPEEYFGNGIQLELTRVQGMEPGVAEFYSGSLLGGGTGLGWVTFYPTDATTCWGSLRSLAILDQIKAADHPLSRKLRDAVPLKITGFICPFPMGRGLPRYVRDGLMVIGSAANFNGSIVAFITGRWAGEVAAEAVRDGDVSEARLQRYVDKFREIDLEHEYDYWQEFLPKARALSDAALDELMRDMARKGQKIMTRVQLPF
ncbi:MAG: NAD(P)/FAD-dependent oxidoreductase [Chloroflexota bacterium]